MIKSFNLYEFSIKACLLCIFSELNKMLIHYKVLSSAREVHLRVVLSFSNF